MTTGGQFSLVRITWALLHILAILFHLSDYQAIIDPYYSYLEVVLKLVLTSFVLIGSKVRFAAFGLLILESAFVATSTPLEADNIFNCLMLLCLSLLPSPTCLSWDNRYYNDPRGNWHLSAWQRFLLFFVIFALPFAFPFSYAIYSAPKTFFPFSSLPITCLLSLLSLGAFFFLYKSEKSSHLVWRTLSFVLLGSILLFFYREGKGETYPCLVLLGISLSLPAKDRPMLLFYDGSCGLCHRAVRFALSESSLQNLYFSPQGSPSFQLIQKNHPVQFPDSLVLIDDKQRIFFKTQAVIQLLKSFGGIWALIAAFIPKKLYGTLNQLYDAIAQIRLSLFTTPKEACPILPSDLQKLFEEENFFKIK